MDRSSRLLPFRVGPDRCGRRFLAPVGAAADGTGPSALLHSPDRGLFPNLCRDNPARMGGNGGHGLGWLGARPSSRASRHGCGRVAGCRLGLRRASRFRRSQCTCAEGALCGTPEVRALVAGGADASRAAVAAGWMVRDRGKGASHTHAVGPAGPRVGARRRHRSGRTSIRRGGVDTSSPGDPRQPGRVIVPVIWAGWTSQWK